MSKSSQKLSLSSNAKNPDGQLVRRMPDPRGVVINGLRYNSPELQRLRAQASRSEPISIKIDFAGLSRIFVRAGARKVWFEVSLVHAKFFAKLMIRARRKKPAMNVRRKITSFYG